MGTNLSVVTPAEHIIWSADVADEAALMAALDTLPELRFIKIDRLFLTGIELSVLDRLAERGLQVFIDAKIVEIPSKTEAIAKKYLARRPWMLNCMAGVVSNGVFQLAEGETDRDKLDALKRFADACREVGTRPCAVTVLTSKSDDICDLEFGGTSKETVLQYIEWLLAAGFTDVVCSTAEVSTVRQFNDYDGLRLIVPGVRLAGTDTQDQARVGTPEAVLQAGNTRLVVGRPLTTGVPADNWVIWHQAVSAALVA
ncbi:MAG: orotidine 5'-phosphate decarboxylase / HUMPS family protein [Patescibacteria group bacterium]